MKHRKTNVLILTCAGAVLAMASPGFAQNALDANLQVGSGGINQPTRDFTAELRFRNAIVTGNAPGGLSFRGDAGYTASRDFRSELASDALFNFRRDSLFSGLSGMGIRGTEALQYQFALTTGGRAPASLGGNLIFSRGGSGTDLANMKDPARSQLQGDRPGGLTRIRPDEITEGGLGSLRSTSTFTTTQNMEPMLLGVRTGQDGVREAMAASVLTGIRAFKIDTYGAGQEPTPSAYDEWLDQMAQAQADPDVTGQLARDEFQRRLDELRVDLSRPDSGTTGPDGAERRGFDPALVDTVRRGFGGIQTLIPSIPDTSSAYTKHMQAAEELLASGRHFDAEERFLRALASRPDDASASIGRVHAQIGAGLYTSAAINLRELLTTHPELASTRYGPNLLPRRQRLTRVIEKLSARQAEDGRLANDLAMILAYVGYQANDAAAINAGLDELTNGSSDRLAEFLTRIWLGPTTERNREDQ